MPPNIGVQLTTRCNLNCTHCSVQSAANDIPVGIIRDIVSYAQSINCRCLELTGGEPTLHPRFPEILAALCRHGLKFTLVTNGWNFAEVYSTISRHRANVNRVAFSLDGATEQRHDMARGRGAYRKVLQAVSICRSLGIRFGLRTTVTPGNIRQLEQIVLLGAKLGADELAVMPLMPTPRMAELDLLLHPRDLTRIMAEAGRLQKIFTIKITLTAGYPERTSRPPCPALNGSYLFVTARGKVSFCCHLANYVGGNNDADIVADLSQLSLPEAHRRMLAAVDEFNRAKSLRLANGSFTSLDHCPCWYCLKCFRKVEWLADFSDSPWSMDLQASRGVNASRTRERNRASLAGDEDRGKSPATKRFRQHPDVIETALDGEGAALMHTGTKLPFHLNATALRIWRLLKPGCTREELAQALYDEFDIDREKVREDLSAFLDELSASDLIVAA